MKIDIARFNLSDVPVDPDQVFTFPQGLVGFEQSRAFALFHEEGKPTVFWLQSVDDPDLSFPIVAPDMLGLEYEIELSASDTTLLGLERPEDALVVVIVYRNPAADSGGGKIAANTRSPLVLNTRTRRGMQKLLLDVQSSIVVRAR